MYKLVIRVEISQIVEHDERVEKGDPGKEQELRDACDQFRSPWVGSEARSSRFTLSSNPERFYDKLLANGPSIAPEFVFYLGEC